MSALERRRKLRRQNQLAQTQQLKELKVLQQQGFRSAEHKKRFDDRVARNPTLTAPRISWNDTTYLDNHASAQQVHKERARNSEILELDYLHQLNEAWLADKERLYVEKREQVVFQHQQIIGLMREDFLSRYYTLQIECVSKQELRIETKMLNERKEEDFNDAEENHLTMLRDFDSDFEIELRRFSQVIRRRTDDWIAHCRLYDMYVSDCQSAGVPVCTRFSTELGHQHISLKSYGLGHSGTKVMSDTIAQNCFLHSIDLSGNAIGDRGAAALALAIRGGKGNGMLTGNETDAQGQIQMLCALRDLRVAKNNITSSGASDLLAACCIGKDRPRTPAQMAASKRDGSTRTAARKGPGNNAMAAKTVVEILDLSTNMISDDIANTLNAVLSSHLCGLRKLDLSYNRLGSKSARAVGAGLSVNRTLRQLSLRWNTLGNGADDIATSCVSNDCLETLDLGFCACSDVCALRFANAIVEKPESMMDQNSNETTNLDGTLPETTAMSTIENEESAALAEIVQGRRWLSTMEQLLLDHNNITSKGALPLLAALVSNKTLRVLDVSGNHNGIGHECRDIIEILKQGENVNEGLTMPKYDENGTLMKQEEHCVGEKKDTKAGMDSKESKEGKEGKEGIESKEGKEGKEAGEKDDDDDDDDDDAPPTKTKKKIPPVLFPCRVGVDVTGSVDDFALEMLTQERLNISRYLIVPGGVDRTHLRHETHETAMTFIIQPKELVLLQNYIQEARKKHKKMIKVGRKQSFEELDSDEEEFEHWLHEKHSTREIPIHAFKPHMHISVQAKFTKTVSRNAIESAQKFGHSTPLNVVLLDWPLPVLPPDVLRRAEMRSINNSIASPLEFRCVISRVSTSKGDGMRFSVTNSMETEFTLPAMKENVVPEEESDSEDEGFGFGRNRGRDKTPPKKKKKRQNWVKKVAEDRKERLLMEQNMEGKEQGGADGGKKEEEAEEEDTEETEDSSEEDSSDTENEQDRTTSSSKKEETPIVSELLDRTEELDGILLTWEPLEKFGRIVVQFYMPTFFVAGLELDLGSTIMFRNDSEFGQHELKMKNKRSKMMLASRQASLGTMRMGKMRQASGTAGRK